jgi:hypothetical protein
MCGGETREMNLADGTFMGEREAAVRASRMYVGTVLPTTLRKAVIQVLIECELHVEYIRRKNILCKWRAWK